MNDTQLHLRVLRVIQGHQKADPITGHVLAEMFGTSVRQVQTVVEELRAAGYKVGSSMVHPFGYFIAVAPEELAETVEQYRIRARHFAITANRLSNWGSEQPSLYEQQEEAA